MVIAQFFRGPYDGKRLLLPTEEPWPRFVIPKFGSIIDIEVFYLLAGQLGLRQWAYLIDDSYGGITTDERHLTGEI